VDGGDSKAWDQLRARLREAASDSFAGVCEAALGDDLRRLIQAFGEHGAEDLRRFGAALETFDRQGRQERSVLVARGLRLCAAAAPVRAPEPKPRTGKLSGRVTVAPLVADSIVERIEPSPAVDVLRGVGPTTAAKLRAHGLQTVLDLAYWIPSGYQDRRQRKPIGEIEEGQLAVLDATLGSVRQGFANGRFMATIQLRADDGLGGTVPVTARWFHRVGGLNRWTQGGRVVAVGQLKRWNGELTMAHPELRAPDEPGPAIAVRYPVVDGVAPGLLARAIAAAVAMLPDPKSGFVDALPAAIAEQHGLPSLLEALTRLHAPAEDVDPSVVDGLDRASSVWHRRLAFDEFFFFQLALLLDRARTRAEPASLTLGADAFDPEVLRACLPFEPTAAQWRVLGEIERDMADGSPMLRLLQGDVGSGKTAVAFGAALATFRAGGQVALMAPTEILAEQHLRTLTPWCERAGLRVALLTGAATRGSRASLLALLEARQIDVLVGTHALLTDDVRFAALGLVVIDEQHRFGVEQRAILRRKGGGPHLLVMTATPIPRTVALCAYGQLEVSIIDELPPGRSAPQTHLLTGSKGLEKVRAGVAKRVAAGDRAFVVCPLVEASEHLEVSDVEATAAALRALMPERKIAVIHGRMTSRDKDAVMSGFRRGESDVLVATTVIEVGVDVPEARLMVIEHAERFGLAQLHQLRGRVGRGGGQSWCLLHTGARKDSEAARRLAILTETGDGFVIAERDLELRGPGEVFGTRQAGAPRLRFSGFAGEGTRLLVSAREAADSLLQKDSTLEHHALVRAELNRRRVADAVVVTDAG